MTQRPYRMVASVCAISLCLTAQLKAAVLLTNVVPTETALGAGWHRQVSVLMDPSNSPPAYVETSGQISEATLREWRRLVNDPTYHHSGWMHARFEFASIGGSNSYFVQVDRFRGKAVLPEQFGGRGARDLHTPRGIGEAAVVERQNGAIALWFKRGSFLVLISSFNDKPLGDHHGSMGYLAKAIDQSIIRAEAGRPPSAEPGGAANRSQPVGSETNRTSSAAGSGG